MENRSPFVLNLRVNCGVVAIERLSGKWCVFRFISSFFHLWAAATLGLCWFSPFSKNVLLSKCQYITAKTWLSSCVIVILMILIMIMMTSDPGHHDDQHHLQLEILQKLFHKSHHNHDDHHDPHNDHHYHLQLEVLQAIPQAPCRWPQ